MISSMSWLEFEIEGIINHSGENIIVTDGEGIILRAVKNSKELYGISSEQLVGKSVRELERKKIFNPSVTLRVIEQRKPVTFMQRTGTGKIIMARGIPLFDERHEKILRVISFSHDRTEMEESKKEYEKLQLKMAHYETEIAQLRSRENTPTGTVINSKPMQVIWELVNKVARSEAAVVLQGESGVGKTVFARALHHGSERRDRSLIEVNCGAIPDSLFESEMFGYEPGAFTGAASKGKIGLMELADGGTLFLDEVGEIPLPIQVKLLKVLQEKKLMRTGGNKTRTADFRLVAATNRNLETMVQEGKFRKDLYYRLNVVPITIPPLRDRKEDIHELSEAFLAKFNKKYRTNKSIHPTAFEAFWHYKWPGNVRELENLIERFTVTLEDDVIFPEHLPFGNVSFEKSLQVYTPAVHTEAKTLKEALEEVEKAWLLKAVKECGSTYKMAAYLGMSQPTIVRRMKKHGIDSKVN